MKMGKIMGKGSYMQVLIILQLFFVFSTCMIAQSPFLIAPLNTDKYQVLDSAYLKITYKLYFIPDVKKTNTKVENELILLVGTNNSKFYAKKGIDVPEVKKTIHPIDSDGAMEEEGRGLAGTEVFKDFKTKTEFVTTRLMLSDKVYVYEEDLPNQIWELTADKKMIYSYSCQKAKTTFRGRVYEAWYTNEIPINNGPWKFGGLPGLVLNISDSTGSYVFECVGIENLKKKEAIKKYDWPYEKITRKEFYTLLRRMYFNPVQMATNMGKIVIDAPKRVDPLPYNPIELE
jgi:GLPGLI family protein